MGLAPTIELQNKELKQKSEHAAREQYNQMLDVNAQKINIYFYS
ncbi:hypothetical protein [Candidatus Williamhamiltonella defendens]|nr:hypothetical protein [Candidatus Hamiltonella defensa]